MPKIQKLIKYLGIFIGTVLVLFLIAWLLLQSPKIQTYIVGKITNSLENKTGAQIAINSVDIEFFKTVVLQDIYVGDLQQDTLLHADQLKANIALFSLFGRKILLKEVTIQDGNVRLYKYQGDGGINIDFLNQIFLPDPKKSQKTRAPWTLDLGKLVIQNTRFRLIDDSKGSSLNSRIGKFSVELNLLNLEDKVLEIDQVLLSQSTIDYQLDQSIYRSSKDNNSINKDLKSDFLSFPWQISIDQFRSFDNKFSYHTDSEVIYTSNNLDPDHIDLRSTEIDIQEIEWIDQKIGLEIKALDMAMENSQFALNQLTGNIEFDTTNAAINNLRLQTSKSIVEGDFRIVFKDLYDLIKFNSSIRLQSNFRPSVISATDIKYFSPKLSKTLAIQSGERISISGRLDGTATDINLDQLRLNIANRLIFDASGKINHVADVNKMNFNLFVNRLQTSSKELQYLMPKTVLPSVLYELGKINLRSKIKGNLNDFTFQNTYLTTQSPTRFKGSGHIKGLVNNIQQLAFELKVDSLQTRLSDWVINMNTQENKAITNLGIINYSGDVVGIDSGYKLNGLATTDIGKLKTDLSIEFTEEYKDATYSGELYLMDFDLSKVTPDTARLGVATIYFIGKGSGLKLNTLFANMEAVVEKLIFNGYQYEYLNIEGAFQHNKFSGQADFQDDNASLDFAGLVNFEEELPQYDFKVKVDTLNFKALNFTNYNLALRSEAQINFTGTNLSNIEGTILMTDLLVRDTSYYLKEDSLCLIAETVTEDSSTLIFQSDFLDARVLGNFDLDLLPKVGQYFVNEFFTLNLDSMLSGDQTSRIQDQQFNFDITLDDSRPLTLMGFIEPEVVQNGKMEGVFDYNTKTLDINGILIKPKFQGLEADTLSILALGSARSVNSNIIATNFSGLGINVPSARINSKLVIDSLQLNLDLKGTAGKQILALSGTATAGEVDYTFQFEPDVILNDTAWTIHKGNSIHFSRTNLYIDQFNLSKDEGVLSVQSQGQYTATTSPDINIDFFNFELKNVLALMLKGQDRIDGYINGQFSIASPLEDSYYTASLEVSNLNVDDDELGLLSINAIQEARNPLVNISAQLVDQSKTFAAKGTYNTNGKSFDISGNMDDFDLILLTPFVAASISELEGRATGAYTFKGTSNKPQFTSDLTLESVHTIINFLNAEVNIPNSTLQIDPKIINFGRMEVTGKDNKSGLLSGVIFHDYFENFVMDLEFKSADFQLMNTTSQLNDQFWGTLNLNSTIDITGSPKSPIININATTLANSTFTLQTNLEDDAIRQSDYIIFANPTQLDSIELQRIEQQVALANKLQLDLTISLDVTPVAELTIILDPISGDRIVGIGSASLVIKMNRSGEVTIIGSYAIESGDYRFSYGQLVNKVFTLEGGSKVVFSGDPLESQLDIIASYSSETPLFDLINNETTLNSQETASLRKRTKVKTMLLLKGDLTKPDITFDIQLPTIDGNILNSAISRKLAELRADPAEMNKQVFSLLLFNSFFPSSSAGNLLVGRGENIALSSVSNLISSQLNKFADKLVKEIEINIDLESYRSQSTVSGNRQVVSELQVGLSKQLFSDRLKISAGADVGLNSSNTAGFSNIAGDFVLEYRLTESGRYLLKVFRKSDYDILKDENTARNGIGFLAKRTFGKPGNKKQ